MHVIQLLLAILAMAALGFVFQWLEKNKLTAYLVICVAAWYLLDRVDSHQIELGTAWLIFVGIRGNSTYRSPARCGPGLHGGHSRGRAER